MKKVLSLLFVISIIMCAIAFSACGETEAEPVGTGSAGTESAAATETAVQTETETEAETEAVITKTGTETETSNTETEATETEATQTETETEAVAETESETTAPEVPTEPEKKSLKILAIGNSFSVDAMEYVYQIAKEVGYEEVVLGNLYIGGCSLQTHAQNLKSRSKSYTYYYNSSGKWQNKGSSNVQETINAEEWDYVSLQQVSGNSGMAETYEPYLTELIDYVKEHAPQAEIFWHMTWAYPAGSDYSSFKNYGYNQATMYNAIVNTVKDKILNREEISFVIPVGTAIQNVRTSYYGDRLSRDNLHLSYDIGRYIASMMWVKQISGVGIDGVTYIPSVAITPRLLSTIKEAVNNAYANPYEVTEASDREAPDDPPTPSDGDKVEVDLEKILQDAGYDISKYDILNYGVTFYAYYYSCQSPNIISKAGGSTASNINQFATTSTKFTKDDIPVGSLIVIADGYQYRPEGWKNLSTANTSATRPGNVTDAVTEVTEEWWGSWTYRAFNIAKAGNPNLTAEQMKLLDGVLFILVPKK